MRQTAAARSVGGRRHAELLAQMPARPSCRPALGTDHASTMPTSSSAQQPAVEEDVQGKAGAPGEPDGGPGG